MPAALKLGVEPCIDDHLRQFDPDNTSPEGDNVSIVVLLGQLR